MEIEYKKVEVKKNLNVKFNYEKGEIHLFGTRIALMNPIPACKRIDKMFGTGGEVIVQQASFAQGYQLFEAMTTNSPNKSKEKLLKEIVDVQPHVGQGIVNLKIMNSNPLKIEVTVKNPLVKTLQGSQRHLIGAFWTGVLSKYFNKQLNYINYSYDEQEDKLFCIITA